MNEHFLRMIEGGIRKSMEWRSSVWMRNKRRERDKDVMRWKMVIPFVASGVGVFGVSRRVQGRETMRRDS